MLCHCLLLYEKRYLAILLVGLKDYEKVKKIKSAMHISQSERAYLLKIGLSPELSGYHFHPFTIHFPNAKDPSGFIKEIF